MRTHRVFPDLQPWIALPERVRELARDRYLVAARIEPVTRGREPAAFLDLTFAHEERSVTVPLIYVDLAQLDVREVDPLVFPQAYAAAIDDADARALVDRLFPELELRAHRGGFRAEECIRFGDDAAFRRARERGLFGAAPLSQTIPSIAPAVYARRFARDARVLTYGPHGAEHAAFVRDIAAEVDVAAAADPIAAAWYGIVAADAIDPAGYDLAIGDGGPPVRASTIVRTDADAPGRRIVVAAPLPGDLLLSFDPADGPAAASFAVASEREPFLRPAAGPAVAVLGGSAGRITLVVRPDAALVPDADTDEAAALAEVLEREGFTPTVVSSVDALAETAPDLVHLFGVRPGGFALRIAEWAAEHRVPLAVHAYSEAPEAGGFWGTLVTPYCFGYSADDRSVRSYLEMLARDGVEVDGVGAAMRWSPPSAGLDDANRVLRAADVVFVQSEREREVVERARPGAVTLLVPPVAPPPVAPEPVGPLVGFDAFVLVHAPIGPRSNQLLIARAAADAAVALVLVGPIEDPGYAERVREFAANVRIIAEPSPGELAALYRAASVVADAAWVTRGHARTYAAAAAGAAVVVSARRWVDLPLPERWHVDPRDVVGVARGIGEGMDAAVRGDDAVHAAAATARERLAAGGPAIVAGYAKIASRV